MILRWSHVVLIFAVCFGVLLALKYPCLHNPPYDDQIVGMWAEADFLARTNFDYRRLVYDEVNFMDGGKNKSYVISILPTLVALLLRISPSVDFAIVIAHVATLALAALSATMILAMLGPTVGWVGATLTMLAAMTLPIMVCPIETLGMEIPVLAATMGCLWAINRQRHWQGIGWGVLAFFCKASAIILLLALVVYFSIRWFWAWTSSSSNSKQSFFLVLASTVLVGLGRGLMILSGDPVANLPNLFWPEVLHIRNAFRSSPDLAIVLAVASIGTVVYWYRGVASGGSRRGGRGYLDIVASEPALVLGWIFVLGQIAACSTYIYCARYVVVAAVVLVYCLGSVCLRPGVWPMGVATLALLIGVNIANQHGRFYPEIREFTRSGFEKHPHFHTRMGIYLERSAEYRSDLDTTVALANFMTKNATRAPIFADWFLQTLLTRPNLGYVPEPLNNVIDSRNYTATIKAFRDLARATDPERAEALFIDSLRSVTSIPPVESVDAEIVFSDGYDPPSRVYRLRHFPDSDDPRSYEDWYLEKTWSDRWAAVRAVERLEFLKETLRVAAIRKCFGRAAELTRPGELGYEQVREVVEYFKGGP